MNINPKLLLSESLRDEMERLRRVQAEARQTAAEWADTPPPTMRDLRGLASLLGDVYQGAEGTFERIARVIDKRVPSGSDWHITLLVQMKSPFPERRPAVISPETFAALKPFLGFRHKVRHVYGFELEWSKMSPLLADADSTLHLLLADLEAFCAFLEQLDEDEAG